jgi:hypothetical protein
MSQSPVVSIGAVFTSLKLAVTLLLAFIALQLDMDEVSTIALTSAGAAITIAVGDIIGYLLTRDQVTPVANPNLPIGTEVNRDSAAPTGVVRAVDSAAGGTTP